MARRSVKISDSHLLPTRRDVLAAAAAASLSMLVPRSTAQEADDRAGPRPWWLNQATQRSRVVDVRSRTVANGSTIDSILLADMLDRGIRNLTGASSRRKAWKKVLGSAYRIVVKFNSVGAGVIRTTEHLARVLAAHMLDAGYDASGISLVEAPQFLTQELGTSPVSRGWAGAIRVADNEEQLARYLLDADAVVNVPFLKTHQIAGMSCCLKNISHAVIRHPARYHANGCSPYVGQVVSSQEVASKLRLNVVDALRLVVRRGPDATNKDIMTYGGILFGFDPLAIDQVGYSILAVERRRVGLLAEINAPHLVSAARMGLGRAHPADIERLALEMGA